MIRTDPEPEPSLREAGTLRAWVRAVRGGLASPEARARRRAERLADLVAFARRRSPLHAERYRGLPDRVDDPRRLPPVTKAEAMGAFDRWVTDPAATRARVEAFLDGPDRLGSRLLERYLAMRTSGSTGGRAIHLHDAGARASYEALWGVRGVRRWVGPSEVVGIARKGFRTAEILAIGDAFAGAAFASLRARRSPLPRRVWSVLDPLPDLVEALNAFHPAVLTTYPSTLRLLARERAAGRLRADPVLLVSVSECLDRWAREEIETAFGRPVRNVYAAAEHLAIALDCRQGRLHLNDDDAFLEPVDDDLEPVPPGARSSGALLTNLSNRVQPVIRYLLTDAVTIDPDPCPCGSPLPVIRVEARRRQILSLGAGETRTSVTPLALATVAEEIPAVARYQIVQAAPDRLRVRFEPAEGVASESAWASLRSALESFLDRQGVEGVSVQRDPEPPRADTGSGKFHKVWSVCGEEGGEGDTRRGRPADAPTAKDGQLPAGSSMLTSAWMSVPASPPPPTTPPK